MVHHTSTQTENAAGRCDDGNFSVGPKSTDMNTCLTTPHAKKCRRVTCVSRHSLLLAKRIQKCPTCVCGTECARLSGRCVCFMSGSYVYTTLYAIISSHRFELDVKIMLPPDILSPVWHRGKPKTAKSQPQHVQKDLFVVLQFGRSSRTGNSEK